MNEDNFSPDTLTAETAAKLIDEWAEIDARTKNLVNELNQRVKEIKEILANYSSESGKDKIVGTDFIASVTRILSRTVPKIGTAKRFEMERRLKQLGLWTDVDMLSSPKLGQ